MIVATLVPLQVTALVLVALAAPAIAFTHDPLRQIVVAGLYTWVLGILFVVFGAPDVALSMIVVGAVGYPLVVLVAIARTRKGKDE
jgi:energy-converting hydrogenase B subunit D